MCFAPTKLNSVAMCAIDVRLLYDYNTQIYTINLNIFCQNLIARIINLHTVD